MSTKSYNLLGSRASHGCIRLLVRDAKWVYDNVGEGVVVTITEDLPNDPESRAALKPAPLGKGSKTPISTPEPTATPTYSSTGMPPQPFRTLKKNSQGEDVYWLQMKLKELGYYTGGVTGTFLGGTYNAVKAFQRANGIPVDGIAGPVTREMLKARVEGAKAPEALPKEFPPGGAASSALGDSSAVAMREINRRRTIENSRVAFLVMNRISQ